MRSKDSTRRRVPTLRRSWYDPGRVRERSDTKPLSPPKGHPNPRLHVVGWREGCVSFNSPLLANITFLFLPHKFSEKTRDLPQSDGEPKGGRGGQVRKLFIKSSWAGSGITGYSGDTRPRTLERVRLGKWEDVSDVRPVCESRNGP